MNRLIILASLLFVATSCSKELDDPSVESPSGENSITLAAQLPGTETRLSSSTDNDEGWIFSWESGDAMGNWHSGCTSLEKFTNTSATGDVASFNGDLGEGDYHRFIYPYEDVTLTANSTLYPIDISSQDGTLDQTYFITQELYTRTDLTSGIITTLPMEHVGGFMAVDIYLNNYSSDYTYTLTKVEYVGLPTAATIDLEKDFDSEDLLNVTTTGTITANLSEAFVEVEDSGVNVLQAIAKINIIPFDIGADEELTVRITVAVYDGETTENLTSDVTFSSSEALTFGRATHNFTYLLADASYGIAITGATIKGWGEEVDGGSLSLIIAPLAASEIDAENVPTSNTWTISDSGDITHDLMEGVIAALLVAEAEGRSIKIIMPNATEIGDEAFAVVIYDDEGGFTISGCPALTAIELPNVTTIGDFAFACSGLTSFDFSEVIEIGESAFASCDNLSEVTNFSLTSIPVDAFSWCGFTSFDFAGVTEVGERAFAANMSLTEVKNFEISTIPYCLFTNCPLTSFDFTWVTEIGEWAFGTCSALTEIELPSTVTSIGEYAFHDCYYLTTVTLNWTGEEILTYDSSWFIEAFRLTKIYIPAGTESDYVGKDWPESLLVEKD